MNINSRAFAQPKLTKRQRKAERGDNFMVKESKRLGKRIGDYIGATPKYVDKNAGNPALPQEFVKVRLGIPFVLAQ